MLPHVAACANLESVAVGDFSERDKSLSLAPCCNETEGEDGRDLPLITGFECVSVPRPARAEPVMIHAYGDKPFKHVSLSPWPSRRTG